MMPMLKARMNTMGPKEAKSQTSVGRVGLSDGSENLGLGEVSRTGEQDVEGVGLLEELEYPDDAHEGHSSPGE